MAAAVGACALISHRLRAPHGAAAEARDWGLLLVVSSVVVYLVERVTRRLLPLAALLRLSLLFPAVAPRRLRVARRAGAIRNLRARIESAKEHGLADEPSQAAAGILELVGALHAHDRRTRGHSERVRVLTDLLAAELRVSAEDHDKLRWSALLHDIGKLHVPARILNKPGRPEPGEWEALHRHPEEGAKLAAPLSTFLGPWADAIAQHHERWDGTGYPKGLAGREISYGARIVGVADAYEVMTASRAYKKAMGVGAARSELTAQAGAQFDPAVVRAFLAISIGRLRWAVGPLSWVAQLPFVGWLPHVAEGVAVAGGQAAGVVGVAAGASLVATTGSIGPATAPPSVAPPSTVTPAARTSSVYPTAGVGRTGAATSGPSGSSGSGKLTLRSSPAGGTTSTTTAAASSAGRSSTGTAHGSTPSTGRSSTGTATSTGTGTSTGAGHSSRLSGPSTHGQGSLKGKGQTSLP